MKPGSAQLTNLENSYALKASSEYQQANITALLCVNASGMFIPPLFMFPGKRMPNKHMNGASAGAIGGVNDRGSVYIDSALFLRWTGHFVSVAGCTKDSPHILLMGGRESHKTLEVIDFAKEHGVILITFPPRCIHRFHPLNITFFKSLRASYSRMCNNWPFKDTTFYHEFSPVEAASANHDQLIASADQPGAAVIDPEATAGQHTAESGMLAIASTQDDSGMLALARTQDDYGMLALASTQDDSGMVALASTQDDSGMLAIASTQDDSGMLAIASTQDDSGMLAIASTEDDSGMFAIASTQDNSGMLAIASTQDDSGMLAIVSTQDDSGMVAIASTQDDSRMVALASTQADSGMVALASTNN